MTMNGKLVESTLYLKSCGNLETETFKLYETLSKKINQPESSFMLGFAYDSLKCAKTIEAILDYFDLAQTENSNLKKEIVELTSNVSDFSKRISKINNVDYETICESLRELSNLEDQISLVYTTYAESSLFRVMSDEFSTLAINTKNFKKIFENFNGQKQAHKEAILEIIYAFETKEADRLRNATPVVRYKNPDSWIRTPTFNPVPTAPT
jgi:hypothetical protein